MTVLRVFFTSNGWAVTSSLQNYCFTVVLFRKSVKLVYCIVFKGNTVIADAHGSLPPKNTPHELGH